MHLPLVSIVIPVYNGEDFLAEAIESALAQTYGNTEILVVNDGSTDGSEEIALSFGDKINYYKKENGGVATALNYAIKRMHGEYFSWLSHDDLYHPQKLELQLGALRDCGDMTRPVLSDFDLFDMNTGSRWTAILSDSFPPERLICAVFPVLKRLVSGCTLLIHKSHFDRVGLFDPNLTTTQDYDLWFRIFRGIELVYLPVSIIISRLHPRQSTNTISGHWQNEQQLYINMLEQLTEPEMLKMGYESKYAFYTDMACQFERSLDTDVCLYINKLLQEEPVPGHINFDDRMPCKGQ